MMPSFWECATGVSKTIYGCEVGDGILLGDSAYPLRPWLLTLVHRTVNEAEESYNCHHRRTRQKIEATFGR
jgi:hypothetical protein